MVASGVALHRHHHHHHRRHTLVAQVVRSVTVAIGSVILLVAAWALWYVLFEQDYGPAVVTLHKEGWVGPVLPSPSGRAKHDYSTDPVSDYGPAPGLSAQSRPPAIGPAIPSFQALSAPSFQLNLPVNKP